MKAGDWGDTKRPAGIRLDPPRAALPHGDAAMNIVGGTNRPRLAGTNLVRAADHNQRVTLHAIRVAGSLTRVELARITGLTAPAIANITRRLMQDGLIEEAGQRRGGRGQPPTKLVVRRDACYSIGVNIDRDHVAIVLVDFAGRTLASVSEDIEFALPNDVRALYRRSIRVLLRRAKVDVDKLIGLGVGMPDDLAKVDLPGRPAGYSEWASVQIESLFDEPFELPVFVENDAAAAAIGEMQFGMGQRYGTFFYILISAGLGGGIVADGSYIRGASGRSGELGFMHAPAEDGGYEQVQRLVSLSGLADQLREGGFGLADVQRAGTDEAVAACVDRWIDGAARALRTPLEAINCLLNPAIVLIGGRLPASVLDRLAESADVAVRAAAPRAPIFAPVRRAELSQDAPAVGAAILPFSHFLLPKPQALWKPSTGTVAAYDD